MFRFDALRVGWLAGSLLFLFVTLTQSSMIFVLSHASVDADDTSAGYGDGCHRARRHDATIVSSRVVVGIHLPLSKPVCQESQRVPFSRDFHHFSIPSCVAVPFLRSSVRSLRASRSDRCLYRELPISDSRVYSPTVKLDDSSAQFCRYNLDAPCIQFLRCRLNSDDERVRILPSSVLETTHVSPSTFTVTSSCWCLPLPWSIR